MKPARCPAGHEDKTMSTETKVEKPYKAVCTYFRCGWHGVSTELLRAPHPFDPGEEITGCPRCRDVDITAEACDEPDCWEESTCGTPTESGYRRTCGKHCPSKP